MSDTESKRLNDWGPRVGDQFYFVNVDGPLWFEITNAEPDTDGDYEVRKWVQEGSDWDGYVEGDQLVRRHVDKPTPDVVNHPPHYTSHPSGVECITVTEHFNFNIGNAIKYLWRAGLKDDALEDLRKAAWYVAREIDRKTRK